MGIRRHELEESRPRHTVFIVTVVIIFSMLLIRVWYLQVIKERELRLLSENNMIRLRTVHAVRGMILDRKGRVPVDNRPSFNVMVMPEDVDDLTGLIQKLSRFLHLTPEKIEGAIKDQDRRAFQPVLVKRDISWEELSLIKRVDLPSRACQGLKDSMILMMRMYMP